MPKEISVMKPKLKATRAVFPGIYPLVVFLLTRVHPEINYSHSIVSNSEMRNFSQDQGSRDPPDRVGLSTAKRCKVNQGIARPAYRRREQANPQIEADIAEKGHFWMETSYILRPHSAPSRIASSALRGLDASPIT